jgi:hypothetical protein
VRGNPHAAFDVAWDGNVAWSRWCDTRRRKGETTGTQTSTYTGAPVLDPTCDGSWESEQRYGDSAEGGAQLKADLWAFQLQVNDAVDVLQPRDLFPTGNR